FLPAGWACSGRQDKATSALGPATEERCRRRRRTGRSGHTGTDDGGEAVPSTLRVRRFDEIRAEPLDQRTGRGQVRLLGSEHGLERAPLERDDVDPRDAV